jgi:hypothetical protein
MDATSGAEKNANPSTLVYSGFFWLFNLSYLCSVL